MAVEFLRPKRTLPGIDMAPLIDCVFQLLIFFMLTSSFAKPAIKLALPQAAPREQAKPQAILVSIDRAEQVYVNQQPVPLSALAARLERELGANTEKQVNIRGDAEIRYQLFVQVMDLARRAGAQQLNILHEPPPDHP